jgi:hypothetical protein
MSRKRKTLEKLRRNPKNVSFKELDKILGWYGFISSQPGKGSSHYVYKLRNAGKTFRITVPYKRPFIRQCYIKQVILILDELDNEYYI